MFMLSHWGRAVVDHNYIMKVVMAERNTPYCKVYIGWNVEGTDTECSVQRQRHTIVVILKETID
jgi:hypothetical protein